MDECGFNQSLVLEKMSIDIKIVLALAAFKYFDVLVSVYNGNLIIALLALLVSVYVGIYFGCRIAEGHDDN